jgi:hydroxyacylglutathione hydrolase
VKIEWLTVGPFQENSYLLIDEKTARCVLVDPGDEPNRIVEMVRSSGAALEAIWLTHGHLDHIGAVAAIIREWKVPVSLHSADLVLYRRASQQAAFYGLPFEQPADPDRTLSNGDELVLGATRFTVTHTPGHSPGHVIFVADNLIVGGDLLFAGSIGRTDLPFSNPDDMEASLAIIAAMPGALAVYPGHGPPTSVAAELATNPYLAGVHNTR